MTYEQFPPKSLILNNRVIYFLLYVTVYYTTRTAQ